MTSKTHRNTYSRFQTLFPNERIIDNDDMFYLTQAQKQSLSVSLEFLLGRQENKICLDICDLDDLPTLFLFQEVWYSGEWPLWFRRFLRENNSVFPRVKVIKINNLKWLLKEDEVKLTLMEMFPNLERVQYIDNVENDESEEIAKEQLGNPLMTSEQAKRALGKLADPFAW